MLCSNLPSTCPDYVPEDSLGTDVLGMVNTHAEAAQEAPLELPPPEPHCIPTALHMKLFDIGLGAFASCTVLCAASWFTRNIFTETPLWAYGLLDHLGTFLITVMGALIVAGALWRHTIPCTAYWPEWTVGKVQALRERLGEKEEGNCDDN